LLYLPSTGLFLELGKLQNDNESIEDESNDDNDELFQNETSKSESKDEYEKPQIAEKSDDDMIEKTTDLVIKIHAKRVNYFTAHVGDVLIKFGNLSSAAKGKDIFAIISFLVTFTIIK